MTSDSPLRRYFVDGLHCAACVTKVEGALRSLPSVETASVNLVTGVLLLQGGASESALQQSLSSLGYGLRPYTQGVRADLSPSGSTKKEVLLAVGLTIPVFILGMTHGAGLPLHVHGIVQGLLSAIVVFYCGRNFYGQTWKQLIHRQLGMDSLIVLGATASIVLSVWNLFHSSHDLYFETASVIVAVVLCGRYLEARARTQTKKAMETLRKLQPRRATILQNGQEEQREVGQVLVGEWMVIRPGEQIPLDGKVLKGSSRVMEAMLTGESHPIEKNSGDTVFGGTLNVEGVLHAQVTRAEEDSLVSQLVALVESVRLDRTPVKSVTDVLVGQFTWAVMILAGLTAAGWIVFTGHWTQAFVTSVGVLVVACPCALGLAVPTALVAATGSASRLGLLIRDGAALELGSRLTKLFLDKTGTLTQGEPQIVHLENESPWSNSILLQMLATAERYSEHPVGKMIVDHTTRRGIQIGEPEAFKAIAGSGVEARVEGHSVLVGSFSFLRDAGVTGLPDAAFVERGPRGHVVVSVDGAYAGRLLIADPPKHGAEWAMHQLRRMKISVAMVTGDSIGVANDVAAALGITEVYAEQTPAQKLSLIETEMKRPGLVAFAGDGVNDAPVLARASLSFAMSSGADVAREAAHVVVLKGDITKIVQFLGLCSITMRIIRQNLVWAFAYNVVMIPLAMVGRLHPMWAALAMACSSLSVVLNSIRLTNFPNFFHRA